ncbi:hypothetical protein ED92_39500 [Amycolatopsis sp. MJM2582]|nr:hypothetical protein ED92_39500 [Amycolatopsis sp. MJM2582]
MGNQGPGTNGSEFFIVHSFANIPKNYSVMGKVVRGMDVLDKIVAAGIIPTDPNGPQDGLPAKPMKPQKATGGIYNRQPDLQLGQDPSARTAISNSLLHP